MQSKNEILRKNQGIYCDAKVKSAFALFPNKQKCRRVREDSLLLTASELASSRSFKRANPHHQSSCVVFLSFFRGYLVTHRESESLNFSEVWSSDGATV